MFNRDLLLIDIETTGLDVNRHEIIQLAAVLLDRKTLKEKKSFVFYARPTKWRARDRESMAVNKIIWEMVKTAPSLKSVLRKFNRMFGKNAIFSHYAGIMDITFMQRAYEKSRMRWPFDHHYFNIWGLFYTFLALKNKLKSRKQFAGFGLEDCLKYFKIAVPGNLHDALVDCRMEAEVLRRVIKNI